MDQSADQSLRRVVGQFKRHRLGMVMVFTAVVAAAVAYALLATPIYRVQVVMAPAFDKDSPGLSSLLGQFAGLGSIAGLGGTLGSAHRDEAIAVLKSRTFTARFIREHNLLPEIFYRHWDPVGKRWTYRNPDRIPTVNDGVEKFDKDIRRVSTNEVNYMVTLTVDWHDRQRAVEWSEQMVREVNEEMRHRAIVEAQHSLEYLNEQASKTNVVALRDAIYRVIETEIKDIMLANVREEYAFRVLDPPVLPDTNKQVWPKRPLIVTLSIPLGAILAALYALGCDALARLRHLLRSV